MWHFKGLISNYRCCKTWKKILVPSGSIGGFKERNITFCTIGYDNGQYIDLVMYGKLGLSKCHILEGCGVIQDEDNARWLKVEKWKSVFL
jgi:hypothetical protein